MKVAVILVLLTTSTVKEKETCKVSSRPNVFHPRPMHAGRFDERHSQSITSSDSQARARLFEILENERHWSKDHEPLLQADTKRLSRRTELDDRIFTLDNLLKENPHLDANWKCAEAATFEKHYMNIMGKPLPMNNAWDKFFANISNCQMYREDSDEIIQNLLDDMFKLKITHVENFGELKGQGTQIKLKLTFENGKKALFKPMRFGIDYETDPDQLYHTELERPNAEIAAFHLDKLLGFRHAVPTVGRVVNISTELKQNTEENKGNNLCFFGTCEQYCDTAHALCGVKDKIRGSVQVWIPAVTEFDVTKPELYLDFEWNPYSRANDVVQDFEWQREENTDYCYTDVIKKLEFRSGRRLLDLIDLSIFDFLTGNQDRHSYETFNDFSDRDLYPKVTDTSFIINLDNGRAFGNPHLHDLDILAALTQCCVVRPSTVKKLLSFYGEDVSLARELEKSMRNDRTHPILADKYLIAIDRRHEIVLQQIANCIEQAKKPEDVLMYNFKGILGKQAVSRQRRMSKKKAAEPSKRGHKFTRHSFPPVADELRPTDFDAYHRKINNAELPRQNNKSNNIVEIKKQGHLRKIDRMITRRETNNEKLPRPPVNDSLVSFLSKELPTGTEAYLPCTHEKTHEKYQLEHGMPVEKSDLWQEFFAEISNCHLYKTDSEVVEKLLNKTKELNTKAVDVVSGAQCAMLLTFQDDNRAIFKPKRFDRNYETDLNHFYFDDFERHHAEIAAFHLDRLLGFRRVPPTLGRTFNIQDDLVDPEKHQTVAIKAFSSPAGNTCFFSGPTKYCDIFHPYCGNQDTLDGSVQVWLDEFNGTSMDSPYKKNFSTYDYTITSKRTDDSYCDSVLKIQPPYNIGRRLLLDLIDLHIFDFLTGNQDRDQFKVFNFKDVQPQAYIFVTENGRGFGNPRKDDVTILAPLTQCCIVRPSTVKTLLGFYRADASLGEQLDKSMEKDKLYPILARKYLVAINRRVEIILEEVKKCLIKAKTTKEVLMNSFTNIRNGDA